MLILESITDLKAAAGALVIAGSHGGENVGRWAFAHGAGALICHDAGIGREEAGIAALGCFDDHHAPAAAVDFLTARIGDAQDMLARGIISRANSAALSLGVRPGETVAAAATRMAEGAVRSSRSGQVDGSIFRRRTFALLDGGGGAVTIVLMDSASSASRDDDGALIITGSHGGLPGSRASRAMKARPLMAIFNDAGIGVDEAGTRRLEALQAEGVRAGCVAALSARIGDAESTYASGVISVVNASASALGIDPGMPVIEVARLLARGSGRVMAVRPQCQR